ncbi:hypothetical protein AAN09_24450 [Salmonella enterica subsp. enterica]|nr:hypothetical protein [Salmonella enterica subsp. enterica serovar Worthington]
MTSATAAPSTKKNSPTSTAGKPPAQARGGLPPGFDPVAWTRQACERSGVTVGVTDPVALGKLRTLTRSEN